MKKYLKIIGLWLCRICLAYAFIFSVATTIGGVILFKTVWKPISAVKAFQENNPEETVFMSAYREDLRDQGLDDSLRRIFIPIDSVSPYLIDAIISAEDDDFYMHPGFDPLAILKAYEYNKVRRRIVRGASTITQQMAKNLFLNKEKTYSRKLKELLYTLLMEYFLGKDRIFELYLNYAQWGKNIFGCEAASRLYYGKSCSRITPDEAVRLAAVLSKPARLSPLRYKNSFMQKRITMIVTNLYYRHKKTFRAGGFAVPVFITDTSAVQPKNATPIQ